MSNPSSPPPPLPIRPRADSSLVDFDPATVFSRFYRSRCETAMIEYIIHQDVRKKFVAAVRSDFIAMFRTLVSGEGSTAARLHVDRLRTLPSLCELKSHRACFCCLMRMPERVLTCGHTFCDTCVQTFGTPSRSEKYTFMLDSCLLCGESDSSALFSFVPPTAGIRILSLDGGGIRGVIKLAILKKIHSEFLRFRLPFANYFDYVCGTSAGRSFFPRVGCAVETNYRRRSNRSRAVSHAMDAGAMSGQVRKAGGPDLQTP